jgi:hypothetical protein
MNIRCEFDRVRNSPCALKCKIGSIAVARPESKGTCSVVAASDGKAQYPSSVTLTLGQTDLRLRIRRARFLNECRSSGFARSANAPLCDLASMELSTEKAMLDLFDSHTYRDSARREFRLSVMLIAFMAFVAFVLNHDISITTGHNVTNADDQGALDG